jgi:hypothetical protein
MTYTKKYNPKDLKLKQNKIDMNDLTGSNRCRFKDRELIKVMEWSFINQI